MSFTQAFNQLDWNDIKLSIASKTAMDVEQALNARRLTHDQFLALISPAATPYLEQMAKKSMELTRQRFGNTVQLFLPLYLSNKCTNICTYCGFSLGNKIKRKTLSMTELDEEIKAIKAMGFDHLLLVTGEASGTVGMDYFREVLPKIRQHFSHISMEVQPLDQKDYEELMSLGLMRFWFIRKPIIDKPINNITSVAAKPTLTIDWTLPTDLAKPALIKLVLVL